MTPCVVYVTATVFTPPLRALWRHNMRHSRCLLDFYDDARFNQSTRALGIAEHVDLVRPWAYKADLWRYAKLLRDGGIFMDAETRLYTSPEDIFALESDRVQTVTDRGQVCLYNALMASPANSSALHRVLTRALRNVERRSYGHADSSTEPWLGITGPCTMAAALRGHDYRVVGCHVSPHTLDTHGGIIATNDQTSKAQFTTDASHYGHHWGARTVYQDGAQPPGQR